MSEVPDDRCGYTWPEDFDSDTDPDPATQNSCCRRPLGDTGCCAWHADPAETNEKTIAALQETRPAPEIREQTEPYAELLDGAVLGGCELDDSISLSRVSLRDASLTNVFLRKADLTDADLNRSDLKKGDLKKADLIGASLRRTDLIDADLQSTNFTNADLWKANLTDAFLRRADFTDADLGSADLIDTDLRYANFPNADLRGADLTDADLLCTDFTEVDLTKADLPDASLRYADLLDADLRGADLRGADLTGADLTNADSSGTDFTGSDLTGATLTNLTTDPSTDIRDIHAADLPDRQPSDDENHGVLLAIETAGHYLTPARWRDNDATDPEGAKLTHRKIRSLLDEHDLPSDIPYHYIRSKQARRREAIKNREYRTWFTMALSRWTTMYGERPWRVVGTSVFTVALCAMIYPLLGGVNLTESGTQLAIFKPIGTPLDELPGGTWLASLYFSIVTFTTLGYGDIQPATAPAQLLAGFESFAGAALLALLVAVTARRITR